ncbi:hypothetical protein [Clostridium butyricum]|uniref:hypothetical protein n=1 Tax=Clostridium butyricum TaxID=1492 RepID=UPI0005C161E8|nr:hypothetical protein [Clostridium butyricum]KIU07774.1 hypothetical protein SC08_Contig83orf01696 [Clostridium butyricum]MBA8967605.1 hypothetical protein [Clostridium butyricum]MBA8971328.1 hypothetical protein [Clostridium butyricum]MBC2429390.1 hypothetical protein [Clostridium butyricum]NOW36806.1 hypothetical protein [Clostridium butyricum]
MVCNELSKYIKMLKEAPNSVYYDLKYKFTYNSNKIAGSMFSIDEVLELMQYRKIKGCHTFDDIVITKNSLDMFDYIINSLGQEFNLKFIAGLYNKLNKGIGNIYSESELNLNIIESLIRYWNELDDRSIKDAIYFYLEFMKSNILEGQRGRIGRLILLKQCIECDINYLIIPDFHKIEIYNKSIKCNDLEGLLQSFSIYKI